MDGVRYPAGWLWVVGAEKRADLGIVPVEEEPRPDEFWFVAGSRHPVLEGSKVVLRWEKVARPMADLKNACCAKLRHDAHAVLTPTDWMVVRSAEGGAPVPEPIIAWRQRVRDESTRVEHLVMRSRDAVELMVVMRGVAWPKAPQNS